MLAKDVTSSQTILETNSTTKKTLISKTNLKQSKISSYLFQGSPASKPKENGNNISKSNTIQSPYNNRVESVRNSNLRKEEKTVLDIFDSEDRDMENKAPISKPPKHNFDSKKPKISKAKLSDVLQTIEIFDKEVHSKFGSDIEKKKIQSKMSKSKFANILQPIDSKEKRSKLKRVSSSPLMIKESKNKSPIISESLSTKSEEEMEKEKRSKLKRASAGNLTSKESNKKSPKILEAFALNPYEWESLNKNDEEKRK